MLPVVVFELRPKQEETVECYLEHMAQIVTTCDHSVHLVARLFIFLQ